MLAKSLRWKTRKSAETRSATGALPLRAELFSSEHLQQRAIVLAGQHRIDPKTGPNRLLQRLAKNEKVLLDAYDFVTSVEREEHQVAPAGEWLLDNFYLVEQQIRATRRHLPRTYSRELPRLLGGPCSGFPRVYDIALVLIAHSDARIDAENVSDFVAAYQTVTPLTLGELWAIPIMLRLGLIENLRRVSGHITRQRRERNLADFWASRLVAAAEDPPMVLRVLAELAEADPPFSHQFVEEFVTTVNNRGQALATVLSWVQHRLADEDLTREQLQRIANQTQAADHVSIGHSIGSLRYLDAMDWRQFVETLSVVETTLLTDPAGVYGRMDFRSRDRYRHRVEKLSRRARVSEEYVASAAIRLARESHEAQAQVTQEAGDTENPERTAHVGFYLLDRGRSALEKEIGVRFSFRAFFHGVARKFPVAGYVTPIAAITLLTGWIVHESGALPNWSDWTTWPILFLVLIAASQMALALVNLFTNLLVKPRPLARLDFSSGIPDEHRTMVVIPTLLTDTDEIEKLLEDLELRYVGNRDPNLTFALLTDFPDSDAGELAGDAELLHLASEGVRDLNSRYVPDGSDGPALFHLFHRPRLWNPHEKCWMGYERKRGKLEQFNDYLRGGPRDSFTVIVGEPSAPGTVRYIITLDTDTDLPRDAARRLVGTMAHPLNRPRFDPRTGRVTEGYAILQPRTPISLLAANRSRFTQLSCGEAGLDPYTTESSDVYQDLFAEGSYVGKGIYDVDAFRSATGGRFPENVILSHDLIESNFARSALVTDVELHEDHPVSFPAEMSRRHRWIRGDWQIAGWLLPSVPAPGNERVRNTVTRLGWWKIFDNLRRSLVPPAILFLLLAGWISGFGPTGFWTGLVLVFLLLPVVVANLLSLGQKPRDLTFRIHLQSIFKTLGRELAEAGLSLASLPYRALIHLDAILASGARLPFTRRGLMIWHTPRYARRNRCTTLPHYFGEMWITPLLALCGIVFFAVTAPPELFVSGPLLLMWLLFPAVGWWISRPLEKKDDTLTAAQTTFLRHLARKTWRYFEVFANEEENWLAPDNFQEVPSLMVAARTSPTNIGLGLLANLAAADFGYLSPGEMLDRTAKALHSMERLERYRGHLYNWYDTRTLKPLLPFYVSSVDSGNLAGALFTLRAGLLEWKDQPLLPPAIAEGLRDTLGMITTPGAEDLLEQLPGPGANPGINDTLAWLEAFSRKADSLTSSGDEEETWWIEALRLQARSALDDLQSLLGDHRGTGPLPTLREFATIPEVGKNAVARLALIDDLARRVSDQAEMDFTFLHDASRNLLSIGYNVSDRRIDPAFYDLLASEARLASYLLVARGDLEQEHWFALGRQLTAQEGAIALLSWSGSMFEYLMPLLLMPTFDHTLLDETYRAVVSRQMEYGRLRGVPWGISESCYHLTDAQGTYQYSAFGVPGLGLKRGLADDLVIAPYASALALLVHPREACQNLERLSADGYEGAYGHVEAIDFTPSRNPRGKRGVALRSYMAHHQGMSLLSLGSVLLGQAMQRRFLSDPYFKASELLLCERIPKKTSPIHPHAAEVSAARKPPVKAAATMRVFPSPHTPLPEVHLLSNGRYHVMSTNAGGGYSRWKNLAVTRWREDATRDDWGTFCYLRDTVSRALWSSAYQPTRRQPDQYEAIFVEGRAEYRRRDEEIDSYTEVAVSPEDDVEVRRITLTNLSSKHRSMELTSYAEVVLADPNSDLAHPAFSNLFVQTEILPEAAAILCTRRARAPGEEPPWMFHLMTTQGAPAGEASYETSRARFIGRTRSVGNPAAFDEVGPLSNTDGSVLDPIVSIRQSVELHPDTSANWHLVTGVAATREAAMVLIEQYRDPNFAARAFEMAWSHSQLELHQLQATEADAQLYARLASSIIFANPLHRASAGILARNRTGQAGLWGFGISGDLPVLLIRIADLHRIGLVRHALKAHAYWRGKGLEVDLVILNEDFSGYRQDLQDRINGLIAAGTEEHRVDQPGGIFVRRSEDLTEEERVLLQTVARVILTDRSETLAQQVTRTPPPGRKIQRLSPTRSTVPHDPPDPGREYDLIFYNDIGGFTHDGREYVIRMKPGQVTPAPWVNILANAKIGSVVSESGSSYTWVDNAHEYRLTPWHNDPVGDPGGEAYYLRDEETGHFWSPTPLPARGNGTYTTRHGFGYSVFEYAQNGIHTEMWTYVASDSPVKFVVIKVHNRSPRSRRLSLTGYWEWVLGQWRHTNLMHVVTEFDASAGAVFARNHYQREFAGKTAFVSVSEPHRSVTCSRSEFLGRNGTLSHPAAMSQTQLSGCPSGTADPCAAFQVPFDLAAGQEKEIVFLIGSGNDTSEAHHLIRSHGGSGNARRALEDVWDFWKRTLGGVYAETPDPALNLLVNGWLEYQTLACRYWGRSGYYQSGGAYGFRDQLQDTTALLHAAPWATREHLLRAAGRQFLEGDVQHWWHPPAGRGVRTHFSDDYLWLPYCVSRYVKATGDTGVLDVRVPYLQGRPVNADEEAYYDLPQPSGDDGTLYDHCARAIRNGFRYGDHGLPLIGCGDWNDGMNLIGEDGRGESVWLAFFLYDVLRKFAPLSRARGDDAFADLCDEHAVRLQEHVEKNAWDGQWYRRAYFDDGTPLGSSDNEECRIDSIAQSWAVLSGAGDPERTRLAMASVDRHLVRYDDGLIQLFDPPFDKSDLEPGYIKGYIPGVRENGGQYTHAAIWTAMAFAARGDTEKAWELFHLLNPVRHALDPEGVERYRIEPYVVAADIYSVPPHTGRGGWSWYTGSAGWMYRLIVETLFGLELEVDQLHFRPLLPKGWDSFRLHYRFRETFYHIIVSRCAAGSPERPGLTLDGRTVPGGSVSLVDDHREHHIECKTH